MLSEASRRTAASLPAPMARETSEVVPVLRENDTPSNTITTGKVKLIAARCLVPSCATK